MDKVTFSCFWIGVFKEVSACAGRIIVVALENREFVIKSFYQTGDTRSKVWCIRFKGSGAQCFFERFALFEEIIDGISLVTVCYNSLFAENSDWSINDEGWVFQFCRIKCLSADTAFLFYKTRLRLFSLLPMMK